MPSVIHDHASAQARADASAALRNLGAEVRAVEEGHRCRWDATRRLFLVKSDSGARTYELTVGAQVAPDGDPLLVVSCTPCPSSSRQRPAGILGCKHRGLVARRLERMGFARFDGARWRVRPTVVDLAASVTAFVPCTVCGGTVNPQEAAAGYTTCEHCPEPTCAECGGALVDDQGVKRYRAATATLCGRCSVLLDGDE